MIKLHIHYNRGMDLGYRKLRECSLIEKHAIKRGMEMYFQNSRILWKYRIESSKLPG